MGRPRVYTDSERKAKRAESLARFAAKLREDPERTRRRLDYQREWRNENLRNDPDHKAYKKKMAQRHRFLKVYGITLEDRDRMFTEQRGRCAVCEHGISLDPYPLKTRAHVDHDHKTGRVRGLLCGRCNYADGLLRSDPVVIRRLAEYVESARKEARL